MASRLNTPRSRLAAPKDEAERTAYRRKVAPWRAWYDLPRWRSRPHGLRWRVLLRDMFRCRMCGRIEADPSQLVADHIRPHRGDAALFWDEANVQCLCKPCHDGRKQAMERAGDPD